MLYVSFVRRRREKEVLILNEAVARAGAEHFNESRQRGGFASAVRADQDSEGVEIDGTQVRTKAAKIAERQPGYSHRARVKILRR